MELRFNVMLYFNLGNENSDAGHIKCLLLQPLRWRCVDCVIHHEWDVREEQHHTYMRREQTIIE